MQAGDSDILLHADVSAEQPQAGRHLPDHGSVRGAGGDDRHRARRSGHVAGQPQQPRFGVLLDLAEHRPDGRAHLRPGPGDKDRLVAALRQRGHDRHDLVRGLALGEHRLRDALALTAPGIKAREAEVQQRRSREQLFGRLGRELPARQELDDLAYVRPRHRSGV